MKTLDWDNQIIYVNGENAGSRFTNRQGSDGSPPLPAPYSAVKSYSKTYGKFRVYRGGKLTRNEVIAMPAGGFQLDSGQRLSRYEAVPPQQSLYARAHNGSLNQSSRKALTLTGELAEIRSTAQTISSLTKQGLRLAIQATKVARSRTERKRFLQQLRDQMTKDTRSKDKIRVSDRVTDLYMGARFALRPIAFTVSDLLKLHAEGISTKMYFNTKSTARGIFPISGNAMFQSVTVRDFFSVSAPEIRARAQLALTINDVIPLIWELTPLSWAIDYFLPVGDYLSWLSGQNTLGVVHTARGVSTRTNVTIVSSKTSRQIYKTYYTEWDTWDNFTLRSFVRSTSHKPYLDPPAFEIPNLNAYQVLDLIGVARGFNR